MVLNLRRRWLPDGPTATIWLGLIYALAVGGVASYGQALIVVQAADGHTHISYLVAALADPIAFVASVNILDARQRYGEWAWWSVAQVAFALLVTLGFNVMAGHPHDVPAWMVRAWPAVAMGMTLHSLCDFRQRRARHRIAAESREEPADAAAGFVRFVDLYGQREVGRVLGVVHGTVGVKYRAAKASLNGHGDA